MRPMGAIFETIQNKLTVAFQPTRLEIEDDSGRHAAMLARVRAEKAIST